MPCQFLGADQERRNPLHALEGGGVKGVMGVRREGLTVSCKGIW